MPRKLVKDASVSVFEDAKTRADGGWPHPIGGVSGWNKGEVSWYRHLFSLLPVCTMCGALLPHITPLHQTEISETTHQDTSISLVDSLECFSQQKKSLATRKNSCL